MARIAIVGDGPAGLSAALFLAKNGQEVLVYGKNETPVHYAEFHNYLGVDAMAGDKFQAIARGQVEAQGAALHDERVTHITADGDHFTLTTDNGSTATVDYIVLAAAKPGAELAQQLGIDTPPDGVDTDGEYRTTVDRVYAVGRLARPNRSHAIISAGAGAVAAVDVLSREAGTDVTDWDKPAKD